MVTYMFDYIILVYKLSSSSQKIKEKMFEEVMQHKTVPTDANHDLENNNSRNVLSQCCLELCDFFP